MKNRRIKILMGLVVVVIASLILYSSMGLRQHRVEVCITFQGRTDCRIASGPTQQEALTTAVQNVCGVIASGMTDSISCQNTPPDSVRWLE
jgi:hypothetical protein